MESKNDKSQEELLGLQLRVEELERKIAKSLEDEIKVKPRVFALGRTIKKIVYGSLALGIICILSTLLKTWISAPNALDWGILFSGVLLCGISFMTEFKLGKEGIQAKMVNVYDIMRDSVAVIQQLSNFLKP